MADADDDDGLRAFVDALIDDESPLDPSKPSPRKVRRSEAMQVVRDFLETSDEACAVMPSVAEELGVRLACLDNCSYCCEQLVLISAPEADVIAEWLSAPGREALVARFRERADAWMRECGDDARAALVAQAEGRQADFAEGAGRVSRHQKVCALHDGTGCTVYEVRPFVCRHVWVAETSDYCRASEVQREVKLLSTPEHERFFKAVGRICRGLQHGMDEGLLFQVLPVAVTLALGRRATAGAEND